MIIDEILVALGSVFSEYTEKYIEDIWEAICQDYNDFLIDTDVVLPDKNTAKYYWLVYLYDHIGEAIPKDEIALFTYYKKRGNVALDQQIRHLRDSNGIYLLGKDDELFDGSNIIPSGYYMLQSMTEPYPDYTFSRRATKLNDDEFEQIKEEYDYHCATCRQFGRETIENEFIPGYPHRRCSLQQGHMNPREPLSKDNCIPQCQICNLSATNRYIFDKDGTPYNNSDSYQEIGFDDYGRPYGLRYNEYGDPINEFLTAADDYWRR